MALFSTVFQKNRRYLSWGLALVVFGLILFSPHKVRPFLGNISNYAFYYFFSEIRNYRYHLDSLVEENRHLNSLTAEYSRQLSALKEAERENRRLRELIGFERPENFDMVPVKIISLLEQVNPVAAVVNKGADDGIEADMPVINRFGLVGKIKEVMPGFATVSLLTDPANPVSGRIAESRQIGIVRYQSARGMFLDNLPADALVNRGDLILTSGLGGVYPAGLSVAIVDSVAAEKGDILKTVWLKPSVDFFEVDELYVLVGRSS
jgi:rod shape-determining protein MreC